MSRLTKKRNERGFRTDYPTDIFDITTNKS